MEVPLPTAWKPGHPGPILRGKVHSAIEGGCQKLCLDAPVGSCALFGLEVTCRWHGKAYSACLPESLSQIMARG